MATTLRSRALDTDGVLSRRPRCVGIANQPRSSQRQAISCQGAEACRRDTRRGLALEATCLDQVDFGASQTTGEALSGNAAKLLLRRSELKDHKKRWSDLKTAGNEAAEIATASRTLAAKLADRQPTISRIVQRAQFVKNAVEYQCSELGDRASKSSKRIRSRT